MRIEASQPIRAPLAEVFAAFADVAQFPGRLGGVKAVVVLSEVRSGVGLRWRETRTLFGKDADAQKEIVAIDEPRSFRVESRVEGVLYTSTYAFREEGGATVATWIHDSEALTFGAKLMTPMMFLFQGTMRKFMQQDLVDMGAFLEGR